MSVSESRINLSNEEVIPVIESEVFDNHNLARFAVGILAVGNTVIPGFDSEYTGYLKLRAKVYAEQTGMIPLENIKNDGTETDSDDERSVHFGIIENYNSHKRVVGAMRLIIKKVINDSLPIEHYYPNAFEENVAPVNSLEVSRFICRHEDLKIQKRLKWPLFSITSSYVLENQLGPTYAVIEPSLEKGLKAARVPIKKLGEAEFLPEYNAPNLPVEIDVSLLAKNIGLIDDEILNVQAEQGNFHYFGKTK